MPQTRHPRPSQVFPHILQNTFRAIGHRTVHRPLCHEYLAPDRTTFSGLSSFYTVLWHITLKAICKKQYSSRTSNTPPPGQPKLSLTFCKTPSGRSCTEPSTDHFVMNISPHITPIGAAGEEGGSKCPIRIFFLSKMVVYLIFSVIFTSDNYV